MRFQSPKTGGAEVDMTPMIDIVFQLIAFFMVVTNFEQTQADERVKLPKNSLAKPPEVKRQDELVLNVGFERNKEGEKTDPDPWVFYPGERFRVDKDNIGKKLKQEARLAVAGAAKMTVVIRADAEVPTGLVQELIRLAQEAKFEKFALKATQKIQQ